MSDIRDSKFLWNTVLIPPETRAQHNVKLNIKVIITSVCPVLCKQDFWKYRPDHLWKMLKINVH